MAHTLGSGDRLARGAIKASYMVRDEKPISDEKWAEMFPEKTEVLKVRYLLKCPVHGQFESNQEAFLSGGYPQLDENKTGKCLDKDCDEKAVFAGYQNIIEA